MNSRGVFPLGSMRVVLIAFSFLLSVTAQGWDNCFTDAEKTPSASCSNWFNSSPKNIVMFTEGTYAWRGIEFECERTVPITSSIFRFCYNRSLCSDEKVVDPTTGECTSPSPKNNGPQNCAGNPINAGTGNKYQREIDFLSPFPNGLSLIRYYNSLAFPNPASKPNNMRVQPWGNKWNDEFHRSMKVEGGAAVVWRPDGATTKFSLNNQANIWIPPVDSGDKLVKLSSGDYQFTDDANDLVETYSGSSGNLLSIADRGGYTKSLAYSDGTSSGGYILDESGSPTAATLPAGLLVQVQDSYGRVIQFGYDVSYRVIKVVDPEGRALIYSYDNSSSINSGNLLSVRYPTGEFRQYLYESIHSQGATQNALLTGIVDENLNRLATFKYDQSGRAISTEHGDGVDKFSLAYMLDSSNNVTSSVITDALNNSKTKTYLSHLYVAKNTAVSQGCAGCTAASSIDYDVNGNVSSRINFNGGQTNHQYDLVRNLETNRVEAVNSLSERSVSTTWHPDFRLPLTITESGKITTFSYDSNGNLLSTSVTSVPQ